MVKYESGNKSLIIYRAHTLSEKKLSGVHVGNGDIDPFFMRIFSSFGILCLLVTFCLMFISGCSKKEPIPPAEQKKAPVQALTIGLVPEQNIFAQIQRYEPLAGYLSKKAGVPIKLKVLHSYNDVIKDFVALKLDGAFFGSFTYVVAHSKVGAQIIALPELLDGRSMYHANIFARRDSGIKTAADMKGKRFAFVNRSTTAGYIYPLIYFKENGISDYNKYLGEVYFTGTHSDTIYDVLNGSADIGAAKSSVYERLASVDVRIRNDLLLIAKSKDVPENGLVLRKDLADEIKDRLKGALLGMDTDPEGIIVLRFLGARRFIAANDEDYKTVYDYARILGIDLSNYDALDK